jgi:cyanophycin synthetase
MAPFLAAHRLGLVSMQISARELAGACERADCFAVLESIDGAEWMVIHEAGRRIPLVAVAEIPATFDGLVRYNVANALHAGVACHLAGLDISVIRRALCDFRMSCETTPGRLNFFEGLPYRLLLDLAHNPDGVARLCEFVDRVPVSGRRIVVFSAPGHNTLPVIAGNARSAAGHFDHYVCFNYQRNVNNGHDHVPRVLADTLRECGIADERIDILELEMDAFESIFRLARPGDFVVFLCGVGNRAAIWERITAETQSYRSGTSALQDPIFTSSLQCSRAIASGSRSARASSSSDPSTPVTTSGSGSSPAR